MASMKGGLMSFLINGFGTGVTALRAVGIVLAIGLFGFWLAWKIIALIIKLIRGPQAPNYKDGKYRVEMVSVGENPQAVFEDIVEFKNYNKAWAKKVIEGKEKVILRGFQKEAAEEYVKHLQELGATGAVALDK
ncbi:MAG: hypothetical protein IJS97_07510 [Prevotella sp.]|jgi:hypothetical protein|nr:hypothetical protein [Prevotella sp.]